MLLKKIILGIVLLATVASAVAMDTDRSNPRGAREAFKYRFRNNKLLLKFPSVKFKYY